MNGKERTEAIMRGDKPDHVSVSCQLSMGYVIKNSRFSPAEFYLRYNEVCVDTFIRLTQDYQFDSFCIEWPGVDMEYLEKHLDNIIDKPNGQLIIWKNGNQTFCPTNDYPIEISQIESKKKPLADIKAIELLPHIGYKTRYKYLPEHFMEPYKTALKKAGNTYSVQSYVVSPLSLLIHTYGIQDTLVGLLDHPDVCKKLLDKITKGCMLWVDNLVDSGLPVVAITAPYEGMGFMSLNMYREFGAPFTKQVVEHIKRRGAFTYIHMCGYINDRLEELVTLGVDGIECFDPPPIGNVELKNAVERIGGRVFIKGNIDPVNTLLKKSPPEIYEDAVRRIKIAYQTQRYILSTACAVSPDTSSENLKVLIRAAEDCGQY